ncbi:hypothetical protein [Desulfosudis oleivorans]|uniref:Uncharacterized protein n=1 Tax=Desulfosudis oleivorans (strain DSM 6200 / JCM 39069 / Hxd3) TaxID=96561 RepID=A8ZYK2_DESOH|nr:hypothetical protein [Desulfosudis oleivorans]ABW68727.1 hypothetical protein Dole_2924 [Desulfosudis oleivorans Hxd3]
MLVNMNDFEFDLDKLVDAFGRMIHEIGLDANDDQQVYNAITVFIASMLASGLKEAYGDDPAQLEDQLKSACKEIATDLEEKTRAFL